MLNSLTKGGKPVNVFYNPTSPPFNLFQFYNSVNVDKMSISSVNEFPRVGLRAIMAEL